MIRLDAVVEDIAEVMAAGYTVIRIYTDTSEDGEFTTLDGTETLVAGQTGYSYIDTDGFSTTWYKTAYYGTVPGESNKSDAQQGGTVDAYASAFDVRAELAMGGGQTTIGQEHEDTLWNMLIEASRLIDQHKRVEPGAYDADDSETRYFAGSGADRQWIDYMVSVTSVAVEETDGVYTTWTEDTDFYTWPYNASAISEPIRALEVVDKSGTTKSVFTLGAKRVKVVGVFGVSSAPPDPIKRACKIQAARWYKRAQQAWQDASMGGELGQLLYTQELDPDIKTLLNTAFPMRGAGV
jgi:hypothetical protein